MPVHRYGPTDSPWCSRVERDLSLADVPTLLASADRLDQLADTAELMGDEQGAIRFRNDAGSCRAQAIHLLDD